MDKNLKAFTLHTTLGLLTACSFWLVATHLQIGNKTVNTAWTDGVLHTKQQHAQATHGKKAVFIGGSNLLFGLDSDIMGAALQRPVVNMGINAGLPLRVILNQGTAPLKRGDIAIFALEYPLYSGDGEPSAGHIDYLLSHPLDLYQLPIRDIAQTYLLSSAARVLQGFRGLPSEFDSRKGLYGAHNINKQGDQINSEARKQQVWMREGMAGKVPKHYGRDFVEDAQAIEILVALSKALKQRGICPLFIPPPMMDRPEYQQAPEQGYYADLPNYLRSKGLDYHLTPLDFMYPEADFFDTPFHLSAEKRSTHTLTLGRQLKALIDQHCAKVNQAQKRG